MRRDDRTTPPLPGQAVAATYALPPPGAPITRPEPAMELLKLAALDAEDLTVISAHLQDAILRPEDLTYLMAEKRFALVLRRFDWSAGPKAQPRRRLTACISSGCWACARAASGRDRTRCRLSLLAMTFTPAMRHRDMWKSVFRERDDPPGGGVHRGPHARPRPGLGSGPMRLLDMTTRPDRRPETERDEHGPHRQPGIRISRSLSRIC